MIVLALESAALTGGVALLKDGEVIAETVLDIRASTSEKLLPAVDRILAANRISPKELGLIAVDVGPGSFTGLKIGIATAQGLSSALGISQIGVVSLEAMAAEAEPPADGLVAPCLDARRGEIYAALYRKNGEGLETVIEPCAVAPELWAQTLKPHGSKVVMVGPGIFPSPTTVGRLGWRRFSKQGRGDDPLLPLYLRQPV